MEKTFPRNIDALEAIFAFIERFFAQESIDPALRTGIDLTVEELFTNMVRHNQGGNEEIRLTMERDGDGLVASLTDFDVEPFDPTRGAPVDITEPLEDRTPGGLGLHLIRKMVDSLEYEYSDRKSTITFRKALVDGSGGGS